MGLPGLPPSSMHLIRLPLLLLACLLLPPHAAAAEARARPFVPADPEQVVARVQSTRAEAGRPGLRGLRQGWRRAPEDPRAVLAFVQAALQQARRDGDPRHLGEAEAALGPWAVAAAPPPEIRLWRATVRQAQHDFVGALDDLAHLTGPAARELPPALRAVAELQQAAVLQVQGRYLDAAPHCEALLDPGLARPGSEAGLAGAACLAELSTLTGPPGPGREVLARLDAGERGPAWLALLRAEAAERAGEVDEALRLYRRALAAQPEVYVRVALADALIDRGRWDEVLALLADAPAAEALLLRRARAEQQLRRPEARETLARLRATLDAQALREDRGHAREAAWHALHLLRDSAAALALAEQNWRQQREPVDARLLIEAATAAARPAAAEPVRRFLRETGLQDRRLLVALAALDAAERRRAAAPPAASATPEARR